MPFFLISVLIFFLVLKRQDKSRAVLVLSVLFLYIVLILLEQVYLEHVYDRSFELSDPSQYIELTSHLSFDGLIGFLTSEKYASNGFYYAINWIYYNTLFHNQPLTGILLKTTNAIFFLLAYVVLRRRINRSIVMLDWIILFHPWLLMMIIRNVRDAYILFLLSLILQIALTEKLRFRNAVGVIFSGAAMYSIRSFFIGIILMLLSLNFFEKKNGWKKFAIIIAAFGLLALTAYNYRQEIVISITNVFLGNLVYFGGEDQGDVDLLMNNVAETGAVGSDIASLFIRKIIYAIPVFLFTPHPYNWGVKYLDQRQDGLYGIYTDADNLLIIFGASFNYLFVYPLLLKYISNIHRIDAKYSVIPFFIIVIYSVFLLGNADIRIRYTFIFFLVFAFYGSGNTLYKTYSDIKYFLISIIALLLIPFISN
jgi:hypothetical protein